MKNEQLSKERALDIFRFSHWSLNEYWSVHEPTKNHPEGLKVTAAGIWTAAVIPGIVSFSNRQSGKPNNLLGIM